LRKRLVGLEVASLWAVLITNAHTSEGAEGDRAHTTKHRRCESIPQLTSF